MDDIETNYIIDTVCFIAAFGYRFLQLYYFDIHTGAWSHKQDGPQFDSLSIEQAIAAKRLRRTAIPPHRRESLYRSYLAAAHEHAKALSDSPDHDRHLVCAPDELQFFALDDRCAVTAMPG